MIQKLDSTEEAVEQEGPGRADRSRRHLRRTAALVALAMVATLGVGVASAGADTTVGGVRITDTHVVCGAWLTVGVNGPLSAPPNVYVQIWLYDYSAGTWVVGNWHNIVHYEQFENDFNFGHHGYYAVALKYMVLTNAGWQTAWEGFPYYYQRNRYGSVTGTASTCYI
jgi:hypothetical protein